MASKKLLERLSECSVLVQVALDFDNMLDAISLAARLRDLGKPVILEAGTPLIKSAGMSAVETLKAIPGSHLVMADTKTVDASALELSMASRAGADAFSILSVAPVESIKEAVNASREYGLAVYGDMIASDNPLEDARTMRELGVDVALLHVGVDVQKRLGLTASKLLSLIKDVKEEFRGPVAVAGGIKPGETAMVVGAGADIVIIGSAITRASDPSSALREALESAKPRC